MNTHRMIVIGVMAWGIFFFLPPLQAKSGGEAIVQTNKSNKDTSVTIQNHIRMIKPAQGTDNYYMAGKDTIEVEWRGIGYEDTIAIYMGKGDNPPLTLITDKATGFRHRFLAPDSSAGYYRLYTKTLSRMAMQHQLYDFLPVGIPVVEARWCKDGRKIVMLCRHSNQDSVIQVWDFPQHRRLYTIKNYPGIIKRFYLDSAGSRLLVYGTDKAIHIYSTEDGIELLNLPHQDSVISAVWNYSYTKIASISSDNIVHLWDSFTGKEIHAYKDAKHPLQDISISLDDECVIASVRTSKLNAEDTALYWWGTKVVKPAYAVKQKVIVPSAELPENQSMILNIYATGKTTAKVILDKYIVDIQASIIGDSIFTVKSTNQTDYRDLFPTGVAKSYYILPYGTVTVVGNNGIVYHPEYKFDGSSSYPHNKYKIIDQALSTYRNKTAFSTFENRIVIFIDSLKGLPADTRYIEDYLPQKHSDKITSLDWYPDDDRFISSSLDGTVRMWNVDLDNDLLGSAYEGITKQPYVILTNPGRTIKEIDFGDVPVTQVRKKFIDSLYLSLNYADTIYTIYIEAEPAFRIAVSTLNKLPQVVKMFRSFSIDAEFAPTRVGDYRATLVITTNNGEFRIPVKGRGVRQGLDILIETIQFPTTEVNTKSTRSWVIRIVNGKSTLELRELNIANDIQKEFSLTKGIEAGLLKPGEIRTVDGEFSPKNIGLRTATVMIRIRDIQLPNEDTIYVTIQGEGTKAERTAVLFIGDTSAVVGDIVEIPITLSNPKAIVQSGATSIACTLRYNYSLLYPLEPTPRGSIQNNERRIPLVLMIDTATTELTRLKFRTALGNDSLTSLVLEDINIKGTASLTTRNGSFLLSSLCRSATPRLLEETSTMQVLLHPNPVQDKLIVNIFHYSNDASKGEIVDQLGHIVQKFSIDNRADQEEKDLSISLDISHLAAGIYGVKVGNIVSFFIKE